jgi:hypothetical protein
MSSWVKDLMCGLICGRVNNLLGGVASKAYEGGSVHQGFHNMLYVAPSDADDTPIKVTTVTHGQQHACCLLLLHEALRRQGRLQLKSHLLPTAASGEQLFWAALHDACS